MAEPALGAAETAVVRSVLDRLYPADELGPGAADLGIGEYALPAIAGHHFAIAEWIAECLRGLSAGAERLHETPFAELPAAAQDETLALLERGELDEVADGAGFFNLIHHLMLEGAFGDPRHGGNRGLAGWALLGFPGLRLVVPAEEQELDRPYTGPRRSIADYPELPRA